MGDAKSPADANSQIHTGTGYGFQLVLLFTLLKEIPADIHVILETSVNMCYIEISGKPVKRPT